MEQWQIWIDTGGTFTDCLALDPQGAFHRTKVLSSGKLRGKVKSGEGKSAQVSQGWGVDGDIFTG